MPPAALQLADIFFLLLEDDEEKHLDNQVAQAPTNSMITQHIVCFPLRCCLFQSQHSVGFMAVLMAEGTKGREGSKKDEQALRGRTAKEFLRPSALLSFPPFCRIFQTRTLDFGFLKGSAKEVESGIASTLE